MGIVVKFIQAWKTKWQSRDWGILQSRSRNSAWTHIRYLNLCLAPWWWNYSSLKFQFSNVIWHQRCGEFSPCIYLDSSEYNICCLICAIVSLEIVRDVLVQGKDAVGLCSWGFPSLQVNSGPWWGAAPGDQTLRKFPKWEWKRISGSVTCYWMNFPVNGNCFISTYPLLIAGLKPNKSNPG